jgi:hypothetical protein
MSIGEILDRAISTYVRRFIPLFAILAITVVPTALFQLMAAPGIEHMNALFAEMNRLPVSDMLDRNRLLTQALGSLNFGALSAMFIVGPVLLYPFSRTALIVFANAVLDDAPVTIATAFRASVGRWLPQNVTALGYLVIAAVAFFIVIVAYVIVILLVFLAASRQSVVAGTAAIIVSIPFFLFMFVLYALINVAWELSCVSVALEEPNPVRAIGNGLRRSLDPALRRRTIGIALAYLAIEVIGIGALAGAGAFVGSLLHQQFVSEVFSAGAQIVITGVLSTFMVVYSRDVRLRREGSDLLLAASEPPPLP